MHARGGAPLPRPAGPRPGPRRLCRDNEDSGERRSHARGARRDDEELGPDERGRTRHVERDARGDEAEGVTGDTIFALSSGSPPAAIALVRISGPAADSALQSLAGPLPEPRRAALIELRGEEGPLDRAIVLRFPGPASVTGEDVVELHLHGGRAVVAAVLDALGAI